MISAEVKGDKEVAVNLGRDLRQFLASLRNVMRDIGYGNESAIKAGKLSGQVLHRRSGRLSSGVHTNIVETETTISSQTGIGPDLLYGKLHEEGGIFTVKEHMRTIKQAWGRPITPRQVLVRQHQMTLPERSWLRSTFRERQELNLDKIKRAVEEFTK